MTNFNLRDRLAKLNIDKVDVIVIIFLAFFITILFSAMVRSRLDDGQPFDYQSQMQDAENYVQTGEPRKPRPNFLYFMAIVAVERTIPPLGNDFYEASVLVNIVYYTAAGIIIYFMLRSAVPRPLPYITAFAMILLTISLQVIMPINIFTPDPPTALYFGYVSPSPHHNPTTVMLKPFALLMFIFAVMVFTKPHSRPTIALIVTATIITILATLVKPNYIISLLPTLGLYTLFHRFYRGRPLNWWLLIVGFFVAAVLPLAWQYLYTYNRSDYYESSVALEAFVFMGANDPVKWLLIPKFLLSILFPLSVYIAYFKDASRELKLNLAWLAFGVGAFYAYFVVETGLKKDHGNFVWSGSITLFILFVVSMVYFLRQNKETLWTRERMPDKRFFICAAAYALHMVASVHWFILNLGDSWV